MPPGTTRSVNTTAGKWWRTQQRRDTIIAERAGFVMPLLMEMRRSPSAVNLRLDHAMTVHGNRRVLAHSACNSTRTLERRSASKSVCRTASL